MEPPRPELTEALPELKDLNEGHDIDLEQWLSMFGTVPHAIAYGSLFWPEFVEYEGCLLWADFNRETFDNWVESQKGNLTAIELVMNHRHITDLFLNASEEPTVEQVAYLGWQLRDAWTLKLRHDFPHLDVKVEFDWNDLEANEDAQLLVYCHRE